MEKEASRAPSKVWRHGYMVRRGFLISVFDPKIRILTPFINQILQTDLEELKPHGWLHWGWEKLKKYPGCINIFLESGPASAQGSKLWL